MAVSTENRLKRQALRWLPWLLVSLLSYWFVPTWIWHVRRTLDPFTFNDDARILIWPWFRCADPRLFPGDPFIPYYLAGLPEGFSALYSAVGRLGWAKPTSELLQYVSVLTVVASLAATARRLGGNVAAFLVAALVLGSETFFERAGGGLPRAFAFPLVSMGIYALATARPRLLAALTVAGAAFYPVVAALLGLSLLFLLVLPAQLRQRACATRDPDAQRQRWYATSAWGGRALLLGLTLCCCVCLSVPMSLRLRAYGAPIAPAMLSAYPEAGRGGRLTREQHPPYEGFATVLARHTRSALLGTGAPIAGRTATLLRGTDQSTNAIVVGIVLIAALRVAGLARRRPEVVRPYLLLAAAWLGHFLACLVAPRLFLPERYAQFGVPPLMVLLVAVGFGHGKLDAGGSLRDLLLPIGSAFLLLACIGGRGTSWAGIEVYVPQERRPLYVALAQLPRDAVIAGWPVGPLENIPYLSERRVLTNFQLEMPFHSGFTLQSRARLQALFEAYFATSRGPVARLCSEFKVTHFLIDPMQFARTAPDYYAPHRAQLAWLYAAADNAESFVTQLARRPTTQLFEGGYALVDLTTIPELAPECSDGMHR